MRNVFAARWLLAPLVRLGSAFAAEHTLMPSPRTVHIGHFNATNRPVLTINSGDIVTLEAATQLEPEAIDASASYRRASFRNMCATSIARCTDRGPGPHVLTGPIFVNGAMPGDVLELRILDVRLAVGYGYNRQRPFAGTLPNEFTQVWQRVLRINREAKTTEIAPGVVIPLDRPFFGTMGVAPPAVMGRIGSGPPGVHTGNLDNKDLGAGTVLYMPVHVAGALFSAGDGHGAQGHGEVDLSAVETGLRGRFQFIVRKDMKLTWPRAETPTHWIVMGLNEDLDDAMQIAVRETISFITERFPKLTTRRSLRHRQRRRGLPRDPGGRRHQGHPRHDPEIDLRRALTCTRIESNSVFATVES